MPSTQKSLDVRDRVRVKRPQIYNVIFHNDDFTPMDFVTFVLRDIFFLGAVKAYEIMMKIHTEGSAIVGQYDYDTASSKADLTISRAREEGYPLNVTVELPELPL